MGGLIAEIFVNLLLALGIFVFQWSVRHKDFTKAFLVVLMMIVDVIVIFKYFR